MRSFLRLTAAASLLLTAWLHIDLAGTYDAVGGTVTQGDLFRAQAAAAALVAVWLLLRDDRWAWLAGLLVAASSLAAVLVYRYVDVPALGPIPSMYEPAWYARKTLSAVAEAAYIVIAAASLVVARAEGPERRRRGIRQRPGLSRR